MMNMKSRIAGVIDRFDKALTWVVLICSGGTLVSMTLLSVWNVLIMRKALNAPIIGAEDVIILMLSLIVSVSIPLGARTGAHIEIEVLEPRMSAGFAKWSKIIVKLLCVALLAIMAWTLLHAGQNAAYFGETTKLLLISYEPFYYALSLSVALYAVILLLDIWQLLLTDEIVLLQIDEGLL